MIIFTNDHNCVEINDPISLKPRINMRAASKGH